MKRITKECTIGKEPHIFSNTLNSKALKSDVHLSIYNPSLDEREQIQDTIFLLDGDAFFNYTTATVKFYTNSLRAPPLMVVGINVENRKTSFAPSSAKQVVEGSSAFTRCLRDEIIPYVDGLVKPTHHKTLLGHSLAGLYVLDLMLGGDELFDAWIAFNPSLSLYTGYLEDLLETQGESTSGTLFLASDGDSPDDVTICSGPHQVPERQESSGLKNTASYLYPRRTISPSSLRHFLTP